MPGPDFDLQAHSLHSDGELSPTEVVELAVESGVRTLALTDHDTVAGVAEALEAGGRMGVHVVPAVEISARPGLQEGYEAAGDLHVLGYGIDPADSELLRCLGNARTDRVTRSHRMAQALRDAGLAVDEAALEERTSAGLTVGRPHLAAAVLRAPENAQRLREEGLDDASAVLEAYLIPGTPGYEPRAMPTVAEAIEWVHQAGGLAVWAHPFWDVHEIDAATGLLREFAGAGLDGVEAFYVTHSEEQTRAMAAAAEELGLLRTGSSDFHGPSHRFFSRMRNFDLYGCEPELGPLAAGEER